MIEFISDLNGQINGFVWGVPMLVLLVGTGILMTILTKLFQITHIGYWMKHTLGSILQTGILPNIRERMISPYHSSSLCVRLWRLPLERVIS